MAKCQKCKRKGTVRTVDGAYCEDHLPACFCCGCGELVCGIWWHEEHIAQLGVCGNCADNIRNDYRKDGSTNSVSFFTSVTEHLSEERLINMVKFTNKDQMLLRETTDRVLLRKLLQTIQHLPDFKSNAELRKLVQSGSYSRAVEEVECVVHGIQETEIFFIPSGDTSEKASDDSQRKSNEADQVFFIPDSPGSAGE